MEGASATATAADIEVTMYLPSCLASTAAEEAEGARPPGSRCTAGAEGVASEMTELSSLVVGMVRPSCSKSSSRAEGG